MTHHDPEQPELSRAGHESYQELNIADFLPPSPTTRHELNEEIESLLTGIVGKRSVSVVTTYDSPMSSDMLRVECNQDSQIGGEHDGVSTGSKLLVTVKHDGEFVTLGGIINNDQYWSASPELGNLEAHAALETVLAEVEHDPMVDPRTYGWLAELCAEAQSVDSMILPLSVGHLLERTPLEVTATAMYTSSKQYNNGTKVNLVWCEDNKTLKSRLPSDMIRQTLNVTTSDGSQYLYNRATNGGDELWRSAPGEQLASAEGRQHGFCKPTESGMHQLINIMHTAEASGNAA